MPAIDSLLRVMTLRDADAMIVAAGHVPSLRRAGSNERLALPPMTAAMVETFVSDVASEPARRDLDARGTAELVYRAGDGTCFGVMIERLGGGGYRLVVRRAAPGAIAAAAAAVGTVA